MNFELDELQESIRDIARTYAEGRILPRLDEIEDAERFPNDLFQEMAACGFIGVNMPEEYGGLAAGYLCQSLIIEELSKISPSTGTVLSVTLLPLEAIEKYGGYAQKKMYLENGIAGSFKGSFAFTEAGTGSDPKQLITVAKKTGDKYILNGVKRFISNASYEGPIVLFAKEEASQECTAFLFNKFCKGYSISTAWDKVGLHGSHIYDVFLDDVELTEENVLGEHGKGFDILLGATTYGKLAFSAVFTGSMEGAAALAVKYAKEKLHRGKPIAKFPTTQLKISKLVANAKAASLMLYSAAADADTIKDNMRQIQSSTAMLKGFVADLAAQNNIQALNVLGSYGVTKEYSVERFVRDSLIAANVEGAGDIQHLIAANYLLRG